MHGADVRSANYEVRYLREANRSIFRHGRCRRLGPSAGPGIVRFVARGLDEVGERWLRRRADAIR